MTQLNVRYGKGAAFFLAFIGFIQIGFGLTKDQSPSLFSSTLFMIVGGASLIVALLMALNITPFFVVEPNKIILYWLFGLWKTTYPFESAADLKIEKNSVHVRNNGTWRSTPINQTPADPQDWALLVEMLMTRS